MKKIPLTQGYVAVVDDEDAALVTQFKWCAHVKKRKDGSVLNVYAIRGWRENGKNRHMLMHRLIAGAAHGMDVDHTDGNGLNNSRSNLRTCSRSVNCHNSRLRKDNTSGVKGVRKSATPGKWKAQISGKHIGTFGSKEEATLAYHEAAVAQFGPHAWASGKEEFADV